MSIDDYIYKYENKESISYNKIDEDLSLADSAEKKMKYLNNLANNTDKNRFVHNFKTIKKKIKLW